MGKLGPYELLDELGAGGMGRVYRARDAASGAPIALKILDPHWAKDPEALTRFEREARILARVQSPFIARFIEAGSWLGQHYLAMELVPGLSAQKILRQRGPMSSAAVLSIGACVGRALAEVHALGLVHRDVKPGNVIVHTGPSPGAEPGSEPDPERPRAKLCDFGIARSVSDGEALTVAGTPGTPYYMAPEQVRGELVDARADVYALGATLFELASGQPPYTGEGMAVMLAHVTDPVPDLRARRPDVAPELASIVTRALAKEPGERFQDAREMLEAIETALHGEAVREDALPQPIDLAGTPVVYDNAWDLVSAPAELWPHVSNTERLNRAIGLDDVAWELSPGDGGPVRNGTLRAAGMVLRWKENPFEWVAPHRLGVVREHSQGPFEWLRNTVVLTPREGGGTTLRHTIEIKPRGIVGRLAAGIEVGLRMRRALERVYRRIDD
ncbi:MAG: protein kinase, partial [Sandaracinaceae bacterium]|nr:protein kinase [Sandaracinaceae bacterium]